MKVTFIEKSRGCDFKVSDNGGKPLFRLVLPETLFKNTIEYCDHIIHTYPGEQTLYDQGASCIIMQPGGVTYQSELSQMDENTLEMCITVANNTLGDLTGLRLDICQALGCLPGYPDPWANTDFVSESLPLDRDVQGRAWYTQISIDRQRGLVDGQWIMLHPSPENPSIEDSDKYPLITSSSPTARAVATVSLDNSKTLYMAWSTPCYWRSPFPGNACMHILPALPDLRQGECCTVRGRCGVFPGRFDQLSDYLKDILQ